MPGLHSTNSRHFRRLLLAIAAPSLLACSSSADDVEASRSSAESIAGGQAPSIDNAVTGSDTGPVTGGDTGPRTPAPLGTEGNVCEVVRLSAAPRIPQMMIVLDRSGSMGEDGRWGPSTSAVKRITARFESRIDFGLTMFPAPPAFDPASDPASMPQVTGQDCWMAPDPPACYEEAFQGVNFQGGDSFLCSPGTVLEPAVPDNSIPIAQRLDATQPSGGTPTSGTLEALLGDWVLDRSDPDSQDLPSQYALLVTDGRPTCPAGNGNDTTPADIDATNQAIDALFSAGVQTYVIGYDTRDDAELATVLDGFAERGGTGDTEHRAVEDEESLFTEFERITGTIATCSFALDTAPSRPDFVLVELDGEPIGLDDEDGWGLVGDKTIELRGGACRTFQSPGQHTVEASVQCEPVASPI